ncbi:hypothetical protein GCM10022239_22600 [Leifsonia bigeumensis]|uniref:ABC transporter domain-containing protein n=1 Tax=Leifsonella bigeumensis TaxID=433643 RepID=A0ABP7FSF6_9MICO
MTAAEFSRAGAGASRVEPVETLRETLLQLDGISMHYGKGETAITALAGVDLAVRAGELVAIMGASGSGKSTLLTIAGGLTTPTIGEVIVQGGWLSTMSPAGIAALRRRTLGFVFQDFNLIPALTALENVILPLELDGWKRRKARSAGLDAPRAAPAWSALPTVPFVPPWLQIGLVVFALPLVIACGSWLPATRSKVSARRVAIA